MKILFFSVWYDALRSKTVNTLWRGAGFKTVGLFVFWVTQLHNVSVWVIILIWNAIRPFCVNEGFLVNTPLFDENYSKSWKGIGSGCNYQITEAVGESRIDGVQRSGSAVEFGSRVKCVKTRYRKSAMRARCRPSPRSLTLSPSTLCDRATIPLPHPLLCHTTLHCTTAHPPPSTTPAPTRSSDNMCSIN